MNYYELEPEENTFKTLVTDITHRCNMECANCYIPNRIIPDMNIDRLYEFARRLPKRTEFRLMGGEPTVRRDLPDIIKTLRELGHRPTILTNGLRLGNFDYCKRLRDAGLRSLNISMNGADDDEVYIIMDELRCAERKMQALKNVIELNMFININCIIQKGVNDHVPKRLVDIFQQEFNGHPGVLRFRNVGQIGRHSLNHDENYSFDELIQLIAEVTRLDANWIRQWNNVEGYDETHNVLFPLNPDTKKTGLWIKITDWDPKDEMIPDPNSIRRGRITENFKIAPFFEHVKLNEFGY